MATSGVVAVVALLLISYFVGKSMNTPVSPKFHQLTFRRGTLGEARFAPDGQTVIYSAWASHARIAPDGKSIAFFDHPLPGDNRGAVALLDLANGKKKTLSDRWAALMGLAWSPSGQEVWFQR